MAFKKKEAVSAAVNFGDIEGGLYTGGFSLPEGDYEWTDVSVVMHSGFGEAKPGQSRNARLGVMITLKSLTDPKEEERKMFYSLGSSADKSFMPDPNTGKGIVPVAGGSGAGLPNSTNWHVLLQSLYDAQMPRGFFTNDTSVFEGMHAHMTLVAEPKERAGFTSKTSEVEQERKNNNIAVVSEVLDSGRPWEAEAPAKPVTKANGAVKPAKSAPVVEESEDVDEETKAIAIGGLAEVLEKNAGGMAKMSLKLAAAKAVKASTKDDNLMSASAELYNNDEALTAMLAECGFEIKGALVKPVA